MGSTKNKTQHKTQNLKPIYKKWWFWVIIILVISAIGATSSQSNNGGNSNEATKVGEGSGDNTASQDGQSGEFKVGDVIAYDGKEITVRAVHRNYSTGNSYFTPKDGMEYIKVDLLIKNKSDDRISYNALDWEIQDGNGNIENYIDAMFAQADDALGSGDLAKGGEKLGSIVFEIPQNNSGLILHYKSSFWTDKTVEIKL